MLTCNESAVPLKEKRKEASKPICPLNSLDHPTLCTWPPQGTPTTIWQRKAKRARASPSSRSRSTTSGSGYIAAKFRTTPVAYVRQKKACDSSSTMTILAPIALLGREYYAYYLFSSHSERSYLLSGILKQLLINESSSSTCSWARRTRTRARSWASTTGSSSTSR